MKLTIFCGSRFGHDQKYLLLAETIGKYMVEKQIELVYGGSNSGIMGVFSRTILENGGQVTGIYPVGLFSDELPKTDVTTFIPTETIDKRKELLFEQGDAVLVYPGGLGTLEEFSQLLSWMAIGLIPEKPIGILDVQGYYSNLKDLLGHFVNEGFMSEKWLDQLYFSNDPFMLIDQLCAVEEQTKSMM
ncbi:MULTISPECIES: TIGR00730 family Rossman fold protein [unclassified Enterococcus]|uniref:LOG family protein n=1 Tax=unclassified Enterococcus TaxID=2608891 RepID=UPI001A9BC787|nr:TIGR00730 family Rossman fold protein [Enterococcus sp. DIV1271a]MBO1301107.1 TIGR00730 family Rossman fold protein [Enterococcus sp. DIV1271a]